MNTRRHFLKCTAGAAALAALPSSAFARKPGADMQYGLVTYMWAADWDLPTLIKNCRETKVLGVELRTTHKHGVERTLNDPQRQDVRKRFVDGGVTLVGIGSNERFDNPDPNVVKAAIEATNEFIRLSHDVGGTGVKVKPDSFHPNVPREKTIEQIGKALNELGQYGTDFGQQIRLEVHGQCGELPTIKAILDVADNHNVAICWNCNQQDLQGNGLEHNFNLVRNRFGDTIHVRSFKNPGYPHQEFINLLVKTDYKGWLMLESGRRPSDVVAALAEEPKLLQQLIEKAQAEL